MPGANWPPGVRFPPGLGGGGKGKKEHAIYPGVGAYYTLYALEKACLFADVEAFDIPDPNPPPPTPASKPGKKPPGAGKLAKPGAKPPPAPPKLAWYAAGAKWLLDVQRPDGGWSPDANDPPGDDPSEIETALALLFLLRSPSAFHPTTPCVIDARPRAVTPADPGAAPPGPAAPPTPVPTPLPAPVEPAEPAKPTDPSPSMDG